MSTANRAMTTSVDEALIKDLKLYCNANRVRINDVISGLMSGYVKCIIGMSKNGLRNPTRKTITTSIDVDLQTEFKVACTKLNIKINDALERLITDFLAQNINIDY